MKYNKGFGAMAVIMIIVGILVVGGEYIIYKTKGMIQMN